MEPNKINLDARSQETQEILKNISGYGLRWGIYTLVIAFFLIIVLGAQIKFSKALPISAEKTSSNTMRITSIGGPGVVSEQTIKAVIIGNDTLTCKFAGQPDGGMELVLQEEVPDAAEENYEELQLVQERSIVQIIFNNLF